MTLVVLDGIFRICLQKPAILSGVMLSKVEQAQGYVQEIDHRMHLSTVRKPRCSRLYLSPLMSPFYLMRLVVHLIEVCANSLIAETSCH